MRRIMAASSMNAIRARLYFDYPPPAVTDSRMCWVLVDLNKCRVVADLASVIKDKFDFSRKTILNLFIEDCYLPPTESVFVVRDNDSIRVKVESVPRVNGVESIRTSESLPCKVKKRDREADEDSENGRIKKRMKAKEVDPHLTREEEDGEKKKKKKRKKKKKKKKVAEEKTLSEKPVKWTPPAKEQLAPKSGHDKTAKKPPAPASVTTLGRAAKQRAGSSTSETSDSSDEEPPKNPTVVSAPSRPGGAGARKAVAATAASSSSDSSGPATPAPASKKVLPPTSKKDPPAPSPVKTALPAPALTAKTAAQKKPESSSLDSDSSSDTGLVIKRPGLGQRVEGPGGWQFSGGVAGRGGENPRGAHRGGSPGAGRGIGRGEGRFPWRGGGPRGGPRGGHGQARGAAVVENHASHYHSDQNGLQQQHLRETLTNRAVVLQNPTQSTPKQDYTTMPLLAAPPQVGQKIAFKLLELTENYTPEVSEYKEGKIVGINLSTNQIELELLSSTPAPAEPGKFDLVYQTPDGSSIVEYAVSRGSQLTERWESLLEPRLIMEIAV